MKIAVIGEPADVAEVIAAIVKLRSGNYILCECFCHKGLGRCGISGCCPVAGTFVGPHMGYISFEGGH